MLLLLGGLGKLLLQREWIVQWRIIFLRLLPGRSARFLFTFSFLSFLSLYSLYYILHFLTRFHYVVETSHPHLSFFRTWRENFKFLIFYLNIELKFKLFGKRPRHLFIEYFLARKPAFRYTLKSNWLYILHRIHTTLHEHSDTIKVQNHILPISLTRLRKLLRLHLFLYHTLHFQIVELRIQKVDAVILDHFLIGILYFWIVLGGLNEF